MAASARTDGAVGHAKHSVLADFRGCGRRSKSKVVNATGLSGAFFESSEALCGLGEHSP